MGVQKGALSPPRGGELRAGVIEEARKRQRRHRRVIAGLIGTAALVAALLASLGGGGGGGAGPRRAASGGPAEPAPAAWRQAANRALVVVGRHDHACLGRPVRFGPGQMLDQAPPKVLTSVLAVLSKPASNGSRVSPADLRTNLRQFPLDAYGIYVRYARRGYAEGLAYWLVPAAHVGGRAPARCYAQEAAAFEAQTAGLSPAVRGSALRWERQQIRMEEAGGPPGVELLTQGFGVGGGRLYTVDELRSAPYNLGGGGGNDRVTETALVVPNKVTSVTARYSAQSGPGRVAHPVTVTRPAINNVVIFVLHGAFDSPRLTYRSSSDAPR